MGVVVDIILVLLIALGTFAGFKKGLIKSVVSLVGLVAVVIISYTLRVPLSDFLIDKMPFLSYGGNLVGLTSINILIYNVLAFIVLFVILYCILSIIIKLTGFIDTLLKFTVIWVIPSKIGGAIVGFLETWVYLFLVLFVLIQFSPTNNLVADSKVKNIILNHTPIVGTYLNGAKDAALDIYKAIDEYKNSDGKTIQELDLLILQLEINNGLVTKEKANELIETGKLGFDNVQIAKQLQEELNKWLNI